MNNSNRVSSQEIQSELLDYLSSLSPNHVYFLAPKASVLRGYEYYHQQRLESYAWDRTGKTLSASVRGSRRYVVTLRMIQGEASYRCSCPAWNPEAHCKHVVCTLLTTVNVLNPERFRMSKTDPVRERILSQELMPSRLQRSSMSDPQRSFAPFEIVFEGHEGSCRLVIMREGRSCHSFGGMPTELAMLLRAIQDPAWSIEDGVRDFLAHHGHAFDVYFQEGDQRIRLKWNPTATYTTKTELNMVDGQVHIHARCLRFGVVQPNTRDVFGFVIDVPNQTLGPLEDERGWSVFDALWEQCQRQGLGDVRDRFHQPLAVMDRSARLPGKRSTWSTDDDRNSRRGFKVSVEEFSRMQCEVDVQGSISDMSTINFHVEGKEALCVDANTTLPGLPGSYRMVVVPDQELESPLKGSEGMTGLRMEYRVGTTMLAPQLGVFEFFSFLRQENFYAKILKTKKRQIAFLESFFRLCQARTPSEVKRVLKKTLSREEFRAFRIKAEVEHVLKRFTSAIGQDTQTVLFANGGWCLVKHDVAKEALLYHIPFAIWGPAVFEGMGRYDELRIPTPVLYEKLPELYQALREADIDLYFWEKPVQTSQWEYTVDARRPSSIDWFELHPEITCDGRAMSTQDLPGLLEQGGLMEQDGVIRIIDQETQQTLKALMGLSTKPGQKRNGSGKGFIVQIPKLQILDWMSLRNRGVTIRLSEEDEALLDRLLHFQRIDPMPLPAHLKGKLRQYQQEGYQWLAFLYRHRLGACLADDMGLGKTIQAISLFASIKEQLVYPPEPIQGPHLVVLPPSLLFNWEHEIARFYPALRVTAYTGKERSLTFSNTDVVLTTYGLIRRDIARLEKIQFHVIVFDEAQAVKNIMARTTGAARRLNGYFKCAMTGTPLENHVGEYYSLMDLCVPGLLGDYEDLKSKVKKPPPEILDMIMYRTTPFVLRRTKSQILKELPAKVETDLYLELTDRQKALYQDTITQIRSNIAHAYQHKTSAQARIIALTAILKLRQLCLSPRLLHAKVAEPSPKITFLLERLKELLEEGHSALVFSQFTSFLDLVEPEFQSQDIPYVRLDGGTPTPIRKKLVNQFQESTDPSVFLLSLKAGGQGLNLTKASYVFHLDPWWNPAVENQASDRAHRIGQRNKVSIMRLLMRHTIEEKMMKLKEQKLELYHAVLEGATHRGGAGLTQEDFDFLLA